MPWIWGILDFRSIEVYIKFNVANPHVIFVRPHSLFLLRRTEGADEKIAERLPAVIGEVAGSGAGKRI